MTGVLYQNDNQVGNLIELNPNFGNLRLSDIHNSLDSFDNIDFDYTIGNLSKAIYFENFWTVDKIVEPGGKTFHFEKLTRDIKETIEVLLPYDGKYNITLVAKQWGGLQKSHTEILEVKQRPLNFKIYYKDDVIPPKKRLSELGGKIGDQIFVKNNTQISEENLNLENYQELSSISDQNVGFRRLQLSDFSNSRLSDLNKRFDYFNFGSAQPSQFFISKIETTDSSLNFNGEILNFQDLNISDFIGISNLINSGQDGFESIARPIELESYVDVTHKTNGIDGNTFIGSGDLEILPGKNGKTIRKLSDVKHRLSEVKLRFLDFKSAVEIFGIENYLKAENLKSFESKAEVERLSYLIFTTDNSKISRDSDLNWIIAESETGVVVLDIISKNMIYFFEKPGIYDVELRSTDKNGNTQILSKKKCVEII